MPRGDVPEPQDSYLSSMRSTLSRHRSSPVDQRLAAVELFEACPRAELLRIRRLGDVVNVEPGDVVAAEGNDHARFFAVLAGHIDTYRGGLAGRPLTAGDTSGALETLRRLKQPVTLVAVAPAEVFVVGPREFAGLVDEVPGIARRLLLAHVPQRAFGLVGPAARPATRLA